MILKRSLEKQKVSKILLSIKPKFVEEIIAGTKKYEYRKSIFKNPDVDTVVIYCSYPISKAVGEFRIKKIIKDNPEKVWNLTRKYSGIEKEFFDNYFESRDCAYAIEIVDLKIYDNPINIKENFNLTAPQSFCYIKN